jgi:hypothetical protein
VYLAGNHTTRARLAGSKVDPWPAPPRAIRFPVTPPFSLVNGLSLRAFNQAYWMKSRDGDAVLQSAILAAIRRSGEGSFLAVLKTFADRPAPGLLSFCRAGITIALDFPNRGASTRALFRELDAIVAAAGGALSPAKDACMPPALFRSAYPGLAAFLRWRDPRFSSSLWRRLMESP